LSRKKNYNIPNSLKNLRKINEITLAHLSKDLNLDLNVIKGYEFRGDMPSIDNLIKIADYFNVSIDFLILENDTIYPHNIKLLNLAEKIDKLGINDRYKVEASASTLIKENNEIFIKMDTIPNELYNSFHKNLKIARKHNNLSQTMVAKEIGTSNVQISLYEKKCFPRVTKLIKLSSLLNISMHALITGQKLLFNFSNEGLKNIILKADKFLSLEEIKFLIHLMQRIIEDSE
jgi:transcriptional regulator with XRE-family HTH domain